MAFTRRPARASLLTRRQTIGSSELKQTRESAARSACEVHVRQRASRYCEIGSPKSESSRRSVPIEPEILLPALKTWKLACPIGEGDLVFPTTEGGIAHHEQILRTLAPVMIAAGVIKPVLDEKGEPTLDKSGNRIIQPKYAMHAFRHFFARWCINPEKRGGRGLSAKVVQELLGHSSIVMTLDLYGHLFPRGDDQDELAAAARRLLG